MRTEEGGFFVTEKELRKLNRYQLLELLMIQTERSNELEKQNNLLQEQLARQNFRISSLGSMAEAALQVSGILEAAQKAADVYLQAAREQAARIEEEATEQARQILRQAQDAAQTEENYEET